MPLNVIPRSQTRIVKPGKEKVAKEKTVWAQNDLLLATAKTKLGQKDIFRVSDKFFDESGLKEKSVAGTILQDPDTKQVFLAVIPTESEQATFFKARNGEKFVNKTEEFQHKDAIEIFVALGWAKSERVIGDYSGFALTPAPERLGDVEGASSVFEITSAPLVGRALKASQKEAVVEGTEPESAVAVAPEAEEVEDGPASPVVDETVGTVAVSEDDEWDS